jgi:hypothetical protein
MPMKPRKTLSPDAEALTSRRLAFVIALLCATITIVAIIRWFRL